jgi:hypothetical protein
MEHAYVQCIADTLFMFDKGQKRGGHISLGGQKVCAHSLGLSTGLSFRDGAAETFLEPSSRGNMLREGFA